MKPWDKPNANARKCKRCGSQRPGMQPLTLFLPDGTRQRGYWHLKCFDEARREIASRRIKSEKESPRGNEAEFSDLNQLGEEDK